MNIEERIEELLSKMTLHEKVGQLHQVAPSKVGGFEIPEEEAFKLYKSGDMDEKTYDAIINHKMLSNHVILSLSCTCPSAEILSRSDIPFSVI